MSRPVGKPRDKTYSPATMRVLQDLFELQAKAGMTDQAMAKHAGYHDPDISNWRHGKRKPLLGTLADYAEVFGCEIRLVPKPRRE